MIPDRLERIGLVFGRLDQILENAVGDPFLDRREDRALLDHLARDVERQVRRIDDQANETQPAGQEIAILGDQDTSDIKAGTPLAGGIEEIERARAGDECEDRIFLAAFDMPVQRQRGGVELPGEATEEFGIFLRRDGSFGLGPEREAVGQPTRFGARRIAKFDRDGDAARMVRDGAFEAPRLQKFTGDLREVENDPRAARRRLLQRQGGDRIGALSIGRPGPGLLLAGASRLDIDAVGDHESRIEADAELADELGCIGAGSPLASLFCLAFPDRAAGLQLFEKGARAGTGDRAQRMHEIVGIHTDAVVEDRKGPCVLVDRKADREGGAIGGKRRIGQRFVAELFAGIRGIGDQFAQENVSFRVDRMHHQAQQARHVCLKGMRVGDFAGSGGVWAFGARVNVRSQKIAS